MTQYGACELHAGQLLLLIHTEYGIPIALLWQ
jgi:hypothetical protein